MNCIFLSPHFPTQYHRFCQQLKIAGANVLGIGDAAYDELSPAVRASLTEYYRVDRMADYDELLRACGYFTHKYGKIDRIDSLNEFWLSTEARLRDDFNVVGLRQKDIPAVRHKSEMKKKFLEADVPVAPGRIVESLADARKFIKQIGYPVVAKPDAGVGALHTYRLDNDEDLERFFDRKPEVDYIIEGFVKGTIYSYDGLTDRDGKPVFITSHVFSQGIMETVNEGRHLSYYSLRRIPMALQKAGIRCLKAFDIRESFFHIEFFHTAKNEFTALEVNMRPPGGFTTDMFNYACDIDIYRIWAELVAKGEHKVSFERKYLCCYASRKEDISYLHSHEEIIEQYGADICQVDQVPGVFASALGELGYIFRTERMDQLQEIIRFIHQIDEEREA
ncbi:MAG: ATP-grasp domain-containing protein [Desulfobulbaceae bacterium]|nr:ATP-grasp domain-containing protein [Desulfobulbaceae bacterium]